MSLFFMWICVEESCKNLRQLCMTLREVYE